MKTPSRNTARAAASSGKRTAGARNQLRRSTRGKGAAGRASKHSSHWLRNLLCASYVLAIIWSSVGHAAEDAAPRSAVDVAVAPVRAIYYGIADVRGYVQNAARAGGVDPRVAEWIVYHESRHRPDALGDGGDSRGLWQINKVWHPEVSDRCAYDVRCSTDWSLQRIRDGYANEWSTWKYRNSWFSEAPPSVNLPAK